VCYSGGDNPQRGSGSFGGKHLTDKPNTPNNCEELDWSMQPHTKGVDA